jgi:hypothetical protein
MQQTHRMSREENLLQSLLLLLPRLKLQSMLLMRLSLIQRHSLRHCVLDAMIEIDPQPMPVLLLRSFLHHRHRHCCHLCDSCFHLVPEGVSFPLVSFEMRPL